MTPWGSCALSLVIFLGVLGSEVGETRLHPYPKVCPPEGL